MNLNKDSDKYYISKNKNNEQFNQRELKNSERQPSAWGLNPFN